MIRLYTCTAYQRELHIREYCITLILGYIFGNLIQTMIFLLSYIPLRSYAIGYHAKTEQVCFIFSTLLIIVVEIFFSIFFDLIMWNLWDL
ncbi:MAG: accessory gene regulator B family protein [Coprobacillus cateniformis]